MGSGVSIIHRFHYKFTIKISSTTKGDPWEEKLDLDRKVSTGPRKLKNP